MTHKHAVFQVSAAVELNSSFSGLLRGVRWFETDVSRLHIGPILKGQDVTLQYGTHR